MSLIHFDPNEVRLKKFTASTTSGSKKITSLIRLELVTGDPYALASLLNQLDEIEREQRSNDAAARRAAAPSPRARSPRQVAGSAAPLLLTHRGDDI